MHDEGVQIGSGDRLGHRVFVCWEPDRAALMAAVEWKADFMIAHESLCVPYNAIVRSDLGDDWKTWAHNRERIELLEKHGIGFCRLHYIVDELTIYDDVAARLGLEKLVVNEPDFVRVYETVSTTIGTWIRRVKTTFGLPHIRVAFPEGVDETTLVQRIGMPWGVWDCL